MTGCVYQIRFMGGRGSYIGSTAHFARRKAHHLYLMRAGKHHAVGLQRAFNKYGEEWLLFIVLEECAVDALIDREQAWLDELRGKLYNRSPSAAAPRGLVKTPEQREKSAKFHRGRKRGDECKARMSRAMKGNTNGRHTAKAFCGKGHPMSGDNLYIYTIASGKRRSCCRECMLANNRLQNQRRLHNGLSRVRYGNDRTHEFQAPG